MAFSHVSNDVSINQSINQSIKQAREQILMLTLYGGVAKACPNNELTIIIIVDLMFFIIPLFPYIPDYYVAINFNHNNILCNIQNY